MRSVLVGLPSPSVFIAAILAQLLASGCATPGPLHIYSVESTQPTMVNDVAGEARATLPSFLADGERLDGFAYDPFTDHFFLRVGPGNLIRVVDRPARAVK